MTQPRTRTRQGAKAKTDTVLTAVPDPAAVPVTVAAGGAAGVPHILTAILQVMRAVPSVGKDDFNEQQRFKFRGVDAVINALGPVMRDAGITPVPKLIKREYDQVNIGTNRTLTGHVMVEVCYEFTSLIDGSIKEVIVPGEAMDVGDKAISKAMSVAYRTAMIQLFCLATGDPDPDHSTYERTNEEACRVAPTQARADRPQERAAQTKAPARPQPTSDQLSRWEDQIWEVGSDGLHALAVEVWNAGAWQSPVPGKEGRTMVNEFVDRVACMVTSTETPPTRDQFRQMWNVSGSIGIIDMQVTSAEGTGPTLREVLQEVGESLQKRTLEAAAATDNGQAVVGAAAESWDSTMQEEARWQGET
jgi:hypothetical protein